MDPQQSSKRADWESPPELISDLKQYIPFDLDVCAARPNVCERFISENGLAVPWNAHRIWMNPPYGKKHNVQGWLEKARLTVSCFGGAAVCLIPVRPATRWFVKTVPYADLVMFFSKRLRYRLPGGKKLGGATFPSALVVFGRLLEEEERAILRWGWCPERRMLHGRRVE